MYLRPETPEYLSHFHKAVFTTTKGLEMHDPLAQSSSASVYLSKIPDCERTDLFGGLSMATFLRAEVLIHSLHCPLNT